VVIQAKYVHTNIVARDWKRLANFYQEVFGCIPVPPERHLSGPEIEAATGIPGAQLEGMHLRLPGTGEARITLEIFSYNVSRDHPEAMPNQPGFAHIAFLVDDVATARQAVLEAGGGEVGEVVALPVAGAGTVELAYLTDPEGNIIEVQHWK